MFQSDKKTVQSKWEEMKAHTSISNSLFETTPQSLSIFLKLKKQQSLSLITTIMFTLGNENHWIVLWGKLACGAGLWHQVKWWQRENVNVGGFKVVCCYSECLTHQSMACSIPWFPVLATAFSLKTDYDNMIDNVDTVSVSFPWNQLQTWNPNKPI